MGALDGYPSKSFRSNGYYRNRSLSTDAAMKRSIAQGMENIRAEANCDTPRQLYKSKKRGRY